MDLIKYKDYAHVVLIYLCDMLLESKSCGVDRHLLIIAAGLCSSTLLNLPRSPTEDEERGRENLSESFFLKDVAGTGKCAQIRHLNDKQVCHVTGII